MFVDDHIQNGKNKWKNARDATLDSQIGDIRYNRVRWIEVRLYMLYM